MTLAGLRKAHRVLEISAGTGQLTLSLARRGFRLTAIERGTNLARLLTKNIAPFPQATIVVADFDKWARNFDPGFALNIDPPG